MKVKICPTRAEVICQGLAAWGPDAIRLYEDATLEEKKRHWHALAAGDHAKTESYCIGSDCMAWQRHNTPDQGYCRRFGDSRDTQKNPALEES